MIIVTSIISFGRDLITDWLYRHITDDEIWLLMKNHFFEYINWTFYVILCYVMSYVDFIF